MRKGLILAGGFGTRFYPSTLAVSKHLFPIFDKPMIYYPLSTLMLAGIREIAIISNNENIEIYKKLLGDGKNFGISIDYLLQNYPRGIPDALLISKSFLDGKPCALILGDNIFYGSGFVNLLGIANNELNHCNIFLHKVQNASIFGIAELNTENKIVKMVEKPQKKSGNLAITGLYFFDKDAAFLCNGLEKSKRGEFEIIDLLNRYNKKNLINHTTLGRGFIWFDAGTPSSLIKASNFIENLQRRQGCLVGSPEEVSLNKGWIEKSTVQENIYKYKDSIYGKFLSNILVDFN
tara:strand:- start:163 stop:1038 length:876 start_codon:yes stop_codon:yes gene_type:complete